MKKTDGLSKLKGALEEAMQKLAMHMPEEDNKTESSKANDDFIEADYNVVND